METYRISQHVTTVEYRQVKAPKGLTFAELCDWVEENGDGDLYDVDDIGSDVFAASRQDGTELDPKESK